MQKVKRKKSPAWDYRNDALGKAAAVSLSRDIKQTREVKTKIFNTKKKGRNRNGEQ